MRILWLSPWLRPIARVNAESLRELGAEIMLITADLHPESDEARDYERVLLGRPVPTADWIRIARTFREALAFKPDIVVTELLRDPRWRIFGGIAPRVCVRHDDKPHDETHKAQWWIRSFDPWDARADATIVFSEYVANNLKKMGITSPIYVAPLVTDLQSSKVPVPVPPEKRKNFILLGRQRPYKNHRVVFDAWRKHVLGSEWRGDELVIIGNGDIPYELPPHCKWRRGSYDYQEIVHDLAAAKGSIIHSRNASQSGVHVMSMQLGIPPLVSEAGGLPEYQPPGLSITGVDDSDGLAKAIDALASSAEVERQSKIALAHYHKYYAPSVAGNRLLQIFGHVVDNAS